MWGVVWNCAFKRWRHDLFALRKNIIIFLNRPITKKFLCNWIRSTTRRHGIHILRFSLLVYKSRYFKISWIIKMLIFNILVWITLIFNQNCILIWCQRSINLFRFSWACHCHKIILQSLNLFPTNNTLFIFWSRSSISHWFSRFHFLL